jgi:poly-gamma-glutamate synthesis protein (capsule biosynthesis protein)
MKRSRVLQWVALLWALCLPAQWVQAQTKSVSLVFAGDIVLDDAAGALIESGGDPFADW